MKTWVAVKVVCAVLLSIWLIETWRLGVEAYERPQILIVELALALPLSSVLLADTQGRPSVFLRERAVHAAVYVALASAGYFLARSNGPVGCMIVPWGVCAGATLLTPILTDR